jgi:hypothetical protein
MKEIRKFRDMPDWPEMRKSLKEEAGLDPNLIAQIVETEGDSTLWKSPWLLKRHLDQG